MFQKSSVWSFAITQIFRLKKFGKQDNDEPTTFKKLTPWGKHRKMDELMSLWVSR
jgi:hypothetical protein